MSSFPNQPNPNPIQSKHKPFCDRSGKLEDTEHVSVDKGKTSRSHEIDEKCSHKELGSSDRSGKPEKLSEDIHVEHAPDGTGTCEIKRKHTHSERTSFFLAEHRDIASCNADNEFNRAINEVNIDFNIPGVPISTVKRAHGVNVQNLIRRSKATLSDKHFKVIFNNIDKTTFSSKNHET